MPTNEKPDWLRDPTDLVVTEEDIAAGERYYQVAMHKGGVTPCPTKTDLTPRPVEQLHDVVMRQAPELVAKGTVAGAIAQFRAEIAFTLFCYQQKVPHPSKDETAKRLKELWWIVEYLG